VAEDQDKTRTSRRAQRRAEQEQDESAEGEEAAESVPPTGAAAAPLNRRQRRAAEATSSEEDPRDRNARLRESARSRRLERSKERQAAVARGLDPSERVDDAVSRSTQAVASFLRRHFNVVQWLIVLGVVGGIGFQVYQWRKGKSVEQASDDLLRAVAAEAGRVGEPLSPEEAEFDRRPSFPTDEARVKAAVDAFQKVIATHGDATPVGTLAKLGLAGVRYDQGKYADAVSAYRDVKASKLAQKDADVKHRAIEGSGLALEAKGEGDAALKAFKELGNSDLSGFAALGLYHQARMALAKSDKEGAKQLIDKARQKIGKPEGDWDRLPYVESALHELMRDVDPAAAAAASNFSPGQLDALQKSMGDPSKLGELMQQMGLDPQQLQESAPAPAAPAPPMPAPAPMPAAPEAPTPSSP
jgi:hypothetical protein